MLNQVVKIALIAALLVGCASTKPVPQAVCPAIYDPHLCLVTVGSATYGGYGSNRCDALNKLKLNMERNGVTQHGEVECGRVFVGSKGE